jgi:hypothetical protein
MYGTHSPSLEIERTADKVKLEMKDMIKKKLDSNVRTLARHLVRRA